MFLRRFRSKQRKTKDQDLSVLFDESFYLEKNPDVVRGYLAPLEHYFRFGAKEERDPNPLFCTKYYLEQCSDLRNTGENPLLHFINVGAAARKSPSPVFDLAWFVANHQPPFDTNINPLVHYLLDGGRCGCNPNHHFKTSFYLEQYPEVRHLNVNPLVHYLSTGADRGYNPSPEFDTTFYKNHSPDVESKRINPLWHYFCHGRMEGRMPSNKVLQGIADTLENCYAQLQEVESDLPSPRELHSLPVRSPRRNVRATQAYLDLADLFETSISRLIVVGQLSSYLNPSLDAVPDLCERFGAETLLLLAEDASVLETQAELLPKELQVINLALLGEEPSLMDLVFVLLRLIVQSAPKEVYNLGSVACATLFRHYALQLSRYTRMADGFENAAIEMKEISCSKSASAEQLQQVFPQKFTPEADISVITYVQSQDERNVATLQSIAMAVEQAQNTAGLCVEWLLILDPAHEETRQSVEAHIPAFARIIETQTHNSALARNAGVLASKGEFTTFVDTDQLISINWLSAAHQFFLSSRQRRLILHPMAEIRFGADVCIRAYYSSDDADFCKTGLMSQSFWISSFAKRDLFLEFPFDAIDLEHGFAFEDVQFNCDTLAANVPHRLVPGTFYCCRKNTRSLSNDFTKLVPGNIPGPNKLLATKFQRSQLSV